MKVSTSPNTLARTVKTGDIGPFRAQTPGPLGAYSVEKAILAHIVPIMLAALSTVWRHSSPDSASSESVVRSRYLLLSTTRWHAERECVIYFFACSMLVHDLGLSHRACDRCHGQKLRCKRENNDASCLRCQKAGVHCVPRLVRSQRRTRSTASQGRLAPEAEPQETYGMLHLLSVYRGFEAYCKREQR